MSRHAVIKLKLFAIIGDYVFNDVVQYTAAFALNSIPVAAVSVAVGRNVQTGAIATIHEAIKEMKNQDIAKVYLRAEVGSKEELSASALGLPDGVTLKIFEGKIVGTGWHRTETGAAFVIHILHWLGDLNYASSVSASAHPGNPADLTFPAIFARLGSDNSDPKSVSPGWVSWLSESLVKENTFSDIWGNVLHKWMVSLASEDPFDKAILGNNAGGGDENTLAALEKMKPNAEGTPLELSAEGVDRAVLADGVRHSLMSETKSNFTNTTLWGKLIGEWAPAYWFSVVPRVDDALIVPFTGGLQGKPWAVIGNEDYNQADLNAQLHQILRAVGIIHPVMSYSGIDRGNSLPLDRSGFAGFYQPKGLEKGMVLIKEAPKWLSDPVTAHVFAFDGEGMDATVATSIDGVEAGKERFPVRDFVEVQSDLREVMDLYAHQWYVLESLKGRVGELSGKLRFDIAPGSNVLVKAGGARNIDAASAIEEDVFATVTQVTYVINAESQRAGTAFSLAHIRSLKENTSPGTSVDRPPLYTKPWYGATMLKNDNVRPET